ncbi:MAG: BatA domain-containing protein [Planctomycetota bacterium]
MTLLRPEALWALPLVLIPLIIHLIHRRRFQTVSWAAMSFLRVASGQNTGRRKLNRFLLLAVRMLAVAAVIAAMTRPVRFATQTLGGWLGNPVGSSGVVIILVDRSPSMQRLRQDGRTVCQTMLAELGGLLNQLGIQRTVVFDSVTPSEIEVADPSRLAELPFAEGADSSSNIPELISRAITWLMDQDQSNAEIFLCSDLSSGDWRPQSPQWQSIRQAYQDAQRDRQVSWQFHLASLPKTTENNIWIRVDDVSLVDSVSGSETRRRLSLRLGGNGTGASVVPVDITLGGTTQTLEVKLADGVAISQPVIDVPQTGVNSRSVPGVVTLPSDANEADNQFFFVSDEPRPAMFCVGEDSEDSSDAVEVSIAVMGRLAGRGKTQLRTSLLQEMPQGVVWQGDLPAEEDALLLDQYLRDGGAVMCFPPSSSPKPTPWHGLYWSGWQRDGDFVWQEEDHQVKLRSICPPGANGQPVSSASLITRQKVGQGTLILVGCDVMNRDAGLVRDAVALLKLIETVMQAGSSSTERSLREAGRALEIDWQKETVNAAWEGLNLIQREAELGHHAGVYEVGLGSLREPVAVNRPESEDTSFNLDQETLAGLAPEIGWNRWMINGESTDRQLGQGLMQSSWGLAWAVLIGSLLMEGWLSIPSRTGGTTR